MSLKNLFGKKSNVILSSTTLESASLDVESADLIKEELEERKKIVPNIDYTDPNNFAFYGSAFKYYTDAIEGIAKKYPYDGSAYEKLKWKKDSSDLENYIFDNEYPRTNGYINLGYSYGSTSSISTDNYSNPINKEYIHIKGGPNTAQLDQFKLSSLFGTSNVLDTENNRESNLLFDCTIGNTIEFWFKKDNGLGSPKQVIFDLSNNTIISDPSYGRFLLEIHPGISGEEDKFFLHLKSGSNGVDSVPLGDSLNLTSSTWQHFAITTINSGSNLQFKLYKNGLLNDTALTGSSLQKVTGSMLGWIGSLGSQVSGGNASLGYGKLSGSLDEFRYWKSKRTDKDISKYWFTQINGGTNTDDANLDLGVYYKFNEGIFNTSSVNTSYDARIIDYSGRVSNGLWTGYTLGSRNTGSAIVESGAADNEYLDPIIYVTHPDVVSLLEEKQELGRLYDNSNTSLMYYTIPTWIVEDDQRNDRNKLYELTQIMTSFFDELHIKIKHLPNLRAAEYTGGRPFPYASKLLESMGFVTNDLFTNSSVLENIGNRTETFEYEDRIFNVKNHVYQNIYNNLAYIQRSKGTEKSLRNLIRCFGVDDELVKLNIYSNDGVYTFDDRYNNTAVKKKLINFNDPDRFQGSIYQMTSSAEPNSKSFISGNILFGYLGSTLEAEVIFPQKFTLNDSFYFDTYFLTSSIFGMHEANPSNGANTTWYGSDRSGIQIYAVRDSADSVDGYFYITSSYMGLNLTSSLIKDLYTNQKWNISTRIKHEKYPYSNFVLGGLTGSYVFEFFAINSTQENIDKEIKLTASISQTLGEGYFSAAKRIYAGAHRQNFTGSNILENSDIKLSSVKYWLSYVDDDVLREHAKDPLAFGQKSPILNCEIYDNDLFHNAEFIPQNKTLALYWDFSNVTGSDNGAGIGPTNSFDAKFIVDDITSGSSDEYYGRITDVTRKLYTGVGDFFFRNNAEMVNIDYLNAGKHRLPENIISSDMINILNEDEEIFTKDSQPINYYFAIEKSMYQTISEEMLKFFGTITDFNNIVGRPQYRYEREYRELVKLREMFYRNVSNTPDLEKYVDYFKWIDSAITKMVMQLIPASADFSDDISDVVESHVLERNKYAWKLPSIELGAEPPITSVKTIGELKYNWKYGHAPLNNMENTNCLWWKERKEREGNLDGIFQVLSTEYKKKFTKVADFDTQLITITNKNPSNLDVIKPITKFGSGEYLEIDVLKAVEKKDCSDE